MYFLRNRSSYSFETWTTVISTPENLRVCWVWPSKYNGKWCFQPKMCFLRNGSSYSFETWTTIGSTPENLRVHWVWPSKYNGKWCFNPKCVFSEMDHHTALKLGPLLSALLKTSGCAEFGPLNTMESDVSAQNVFSQKWIIIQLWNLYHCNWHTWKPKSGCTEFGPLNTKESHVLAQNVFSQKQIIIQLWNLDHCYWHSWEPQGVLSLAL